mgnify:FL=1
MDRTIGIGGSDAAAICGMDKYRTPLEVYLEKIGKPIEKIATGATLIGKKFEHDVLQHFAESTGKRVRGEFSNRVVHPKIPFMNCQVDGIIEGENAIVECKTTITIFSELNTQVPDNYQLQCQHNMAVHGAEKCYLPFLVIDPHHEVRHGLHIIDRDDEVIDYLIDLEARFWNDHVIPKNPPSVDFNHALTSGLLSKLFPESIEKQVVLDNSFSDLIERMQALSDSIKSLEAEKESIENMLKNELGDAELGICGDTFVSWKTQKNNRLDIEKLRIENPAIYEQYMKKTTIRRFSVKEKK